MDRSFPASATRSRTPRIQMRRVTFQRDKAGLLQVGSHALAARLNCGDGRVRQVDSCDGLDKLGLSCGTSTSTSCAH